MTEVRNSVSPIEESVSGEAHPKRMHGWNEFGAERQRAQTRLGERYLRLGMVAWLLAALGSACMPQHIDEYVPKKRELPQPEASPEEPATTRGSLWRPGLPSSSLFADMRAFRQNDIVVVRVEEVADARRGAETDLKRTSTSGLDMSAVPVIGPLAAQLGDLTLNTDIAADSVQDSGLRAEGRTGRTERLIATVPTVVRSVLPNGNLFVEGHRVVLVNAEEQHLYVSGIIRPIDIDEQNSVKSSMIAEAEIEFVGKGVVSETQQQGYMQRVLPFLWPF